ncbi:nucleotidyltransferase family protein [Microbacterium sp. RD1]|uniref:nucleotidyltransferase family protein n=1 Tax=Microbacterium sp. RD1 TaxID=3457313 RepID=UPI003FA54024
MTDPAGRVTGVILAAGAGTRFGGPKALARDDAGVPWLSRVAAALRGGGCDDVVVVLGAAAADAAPLVPAGARAIVAPDWRGGLSRSLTAGLAAAAGADAAIIAPVDIPGLPAAAVARVRAAERDLRTALVRATYDGRPGHPVLLGATHWPAVRATARADAGAGPYLAAHGARAVACEDLWTGADIDARP